jgi:hypothetical protein
MAVAPVIETLENRVLLTSVVSASPVNGAIGVAPDAHIQVTFSGAMNTATITASNVELLDSSNHVVATRLTYNPANDTATLDATSPLSYNSTYNVLVKGGASGVKDSNGGTLATNFAEAFLTAGAPTTGPGGPILVVTNSTDQFSSYYAEILKAEGLNEFATADVSTVTASLLANYKLVVLGETTLSAAQVTAVSTWVNGGGKLIAMRPSANLTGLLGLTATNSTQSEGYLLINNATTVGAGLINTTIQYHGTADLYTLNGASSLATLYSTSTSALANPAVSTINVGAGTAAAFTFDLAQSIVEMRQGNPAWAGEHRDGQTVTRPDDQFFGPYPSDPQPNWVDLSKVNIPQADEEQRLFANMVEQMMLPVAPTPRFWYFPAGAKAVIVMTGDDHDNGGTSLRWNQYLADGTSGGLPITGTSYVFPGVNDTNATLAPYTAQGFEVALHLDIDASGQFGNEYDIPVDYTSPAELESIFQTQEAQFDTAFPSIPSPVTLRTHGVVWSDFASEPQAEFQNGIRMDLNYYYWPSTWINDQPGMFTGSGIPMRFATASGQTIDVFQQVTEMTDESGQTYPYEVNALLAAATGPDAFYGAFGVNAHTDYGENPVSDAVIASAQAYNVPVISSENELNFEDAKDGSSFSATTWNAATSKLTFNIVAASGLSAAAVDAQVPLIASNGSSVSSISINGTAVPFAKRLVNGIYYAFFGAAGGAVSVQYAANANPLSVTSVTPAAGATNVSVNTSLTATFNKAIDSTSLIYDLEDFQGNVLPGTATYNSSTLTATFVPSEPLRSGFKYTVVVSALDSSENPMVPKTSTFTTAPPVVSASNSYNIFPNTTLPSVVNASDASSVELGVQFSSDVNGTITGLRFYKGSGNTGTHVGDLWTAQGTLLATATFSGESASGWQTVTFSSPVAITAGVTYVASYHTSVGSYSYTDGAFNTVGFDNGPLHALSNSIALGGDGVYQDGPAGTFPNTTYNGANYFVDVVFVPSSGTISPAVIAETPAAGATGVILTSAVTATFNENIQLSTLSFVLKDSNGNTVPGSVTYNATTDIATFTPTASLAASTTYTATVSGAKDSAGNPMTAPFVWNFTTTSSSSTPVSIWANSTIPGTPNVNDRSAVEVGLRFESNVAGVVDGVRFYKGSQNTGTHTGSLWTNTGTLLATGTFTNETASGWQTLNFTSPVAISANTIYVVSYHTTVGFYSADNQYFASTGFTNGPLTALSNAAAGGNGTYIYGAGGIFPSNTYQSSNYWVDVNFTPGTPIPIVTTVTPANSATNVSTGSAVTVTFNEAMNASTITSSTVQLLSGGTPVSATVTYNTATNIATLTPTVALANSTTYTVVVHGGTDSPRVQDGNGNTLTATFSSTFTTAASVTPTVTTVTPATGATGIPTSTSVTVTFNESMNASTITSSTIQLLNAGTPVAATVTYNSATNTATLTPTATLANSTTYTVVVHGHTDSPRVQDNNGNTLAATFNSTFTTAAFNTVDSIWSNSTVPGTVAANDNNAVEVGVRFESSVSGMITGIRFYKSTQNSGTHTGSLWTNTGTLLATGTFSGESASGWQTLTFTSAVSITANTIYVASYHTTSGYYSADDNYFLSGGVTNGPLTALSNSTPGGNGVYIYGSGGVFPSNTYQAGNYYVDVTFVPSGPVIPTVLRVTPTASATGVSVSAAVTVTFNEAMNASTITSSTIQLEHAGTPVAATVTFNSSTNTATLTPTAALATSTVYTIVVHGSTDTPRVQDTSGNTLAATFNSTFTTASSAVSDSIWTVSTVPGTVDAADTNAVEVGVRFESSVAGTITGVRFYKGALNTGTHTGSLWTNTGTLLATGTFTSETASGWQTLMFNTPVAIAANTIYVASYHTSSGEYAADNNYFASSGVTNGPLTALSNSTPGGNGVYIYGSGGVFPSNTYQSGNYYVDVLFTPGS